MNAPLPQLASAESEQALLGGLLADSRGWDAVADMLAEGDFFDHAHRLIFRRIALLMAQNKPVDVVTVSDALDAAGDGEQAGGFAYLGELAANSVTWNVRRYAETIVDRRMRRDLLAASNEIADLVRGHSADPAADLIDQAQSMLLNMVPERAEKNDPQLVADVLPMVVEQIEARLDRNGGLSGMESGFADLDAKTSGLHPGDLIIVAGRPSMGKTTFARNIAERVALAGGTAMVFSMEMSKSQLVECCLSSLGAIPLDLVRSGRMDDDQYARMTAAMARLAAVKLIIDDNPALTVAKMRAKVRKVRRLHGLSLIVVDYIQLAAGDGNSKGNREQEISGISRGLKAIAKEFSVPVIALSQLNRDLEKRPNKRPLMSDLRESGAIEQDADVVVMMYRDEYYNTDTPDKGIAEALIRKQRMGPLGVVPLVFQGEHSRFLDMDPVAWRESRQAAEEAKATTKTRSKRGFDE